MKNKKQYTLVNSNRAIKENKVSINPDNHLKEIKKTLFGVHVPAWNETIFKENILNKKLTNSLKDAGIGLLVYPGGASGGSFIWNEPNLPNEITTDQILQLSKELNAMVKFSINENASPQLTTDWIKYVNHQKNTGVTYWEIGDEPYLTMSVEKFIEKVKAFAPVMKAEDPSIKIIANLSHYNYIYSKLVMQEVGDYIDAYSIHFFPQNPSNKFNVNSPYAKEKKEVFYKDLLQTPNQLRLGINNIKTWAREVGIKKNLEYHIGSFNSVWAYPEDWTVNSLPVGIWIADMLGTMMEEGIDAAAYWALMNPFPPGKGDFGLFSPNMKPYVNYYPYELYHKHFGEVLVQSNTNVEDLSVYASVSYDRKNLYLMLVNKSPNDDRIINFDLGDFLPRGDGSAWILDGPIVADRLNDYGLRKESLRINKNNFVWKIPSFSVVALEIIGEKSNISISDFPNLAKNKSAKASSTAFQTDYAYSITNDFFADNATDGDSNTRWASKIFENEEEYFQVDLGRVQKFNNIKLNWEYWATKYEIKISKDSVNWEKIADQSHAMQIKKSPQPIDNIQLALPIQARYIRLIMLERPDKEGTKAGSSQWTRRAFSLWEFEVYLIK